jgi:Skp family chaperone for outer membrane proteins
MHRIERIIVHVVLLALLVTLFADFEGPGRSAIGDEPRPADKLGPADEVLLRGDDGELVLTNTKGRLAFGERPTERIWSIGAVNVSRLLSSLMDADRFGEARTELQEEAAEQNTAYETRFKAFDQENADITPESPDFPRVQAQFKQMMQEYQNWQQGTMAIRQKLGAEQIESAYRELIEAVDIVAERQGIDLVTQFVPTGDPFESETMDIASQQVRRRGLLRYPDEIDITEAVADELGL